MTCPPCSKIEFDVVKKAAPLPAEKLTIGQSGIPVDEGFRDLMQCCVRDAVESGSSVIG